MIGKSKAIQSVFNLAAKVAQFDTTVLITGESGVGKEVVAEVAKLEGFPMRTVMQMDIGGEQCTTASGQPITSDEAWTGSGAGAGAGSSFRALTPVLVRVD